jgi:hypothetical protein
VLNVSIWLVRSSHMHCMHCFACIQHEGVWHPSKDEKDEKDVKKRAFVSSFVLLSETVPEGSDFVNDRQLLTV